MRLRLGTGLIALALACGLSTSEGGVLPEDRADALYHLYDGGGVEINGPSILVRKQAGKSTSFVANYYVDMVSSASIDVVSQASPYTEQRKQWSLGMDYLRGNTTMSLGYVTSTESDYDAKTYSFSVSQDMFGDLTTLTLSYAKGDDVVGRSDDPAFAADTQRRDYGIGLTQIFTRNLIATLNFETITDEGFLNNPYRSVRYADPGSALGYSYQPELYPRTRTSNAIGLRAKYYLPYRAALEGQYRYFTDTWNIESHTLSIGYTHPLGPWTFFGKFRYYDQVSGASFFNDLFPYEDATNFRGRDKELSPMTSQTLELGASYEFIHPDEGWRFIKKGTANFSITTFSVDYHEFHNVTTSAPLGQEPLYHLDANVIQLFFSFWY